MKELKKLSLKEEVDKEAKQIEKEVTERKGLDDVKTSEDMETSLFNKIQEYEYDKRFKVVYRRKKRVHYVAVALMAVIVLVFGSAVTSVGSKSYWKVLWERIAGDEKASIINVDEMETQETKDIDEIQVYKKIWNELGILPVRLGYMPKKMYLDNYEVDKEQKKAVLFYQYNKNIFYYMMYMNDTDSSYSQIKTDSLVEEYKLEITDNVTANIKKYKIKDKEESRFIAEFEYMGAQYQLMGVMNKGEFEKIVKNLIFYSQTE